MALAEAQVLQGARSFRKPLLSALLVLVSVSSIILSFLAPEAPGQTERRFAQAEIVAANDPAQQQSGSQETSLPDAWDRTRRGFGGTIDYRFALPPSPDSAARLAIYIPRVKTTCDIIVDGQLIHSESGVSEGRGSNRVVFAELPSVVATGERLLTVRVRGNANDRSGLSEVYVGAVSELRPTYLKRWFIQEELLKLANWLIVAMSVPFAMLWIRDRRNSLLYGLFAFGAIMFALRNFQRQFDLQFLPQELALPLTSVTLGWAALPLWVFFTRYVGRRIAPFERFILIFTIVGSVVLFFVPARHFALIETLGWRTPMLFSGIFCVAVLVTETIKNPTRSRQLMACALVAQVVPAAHDLLWTFGIFGFSSLQWFPLSFPVLLVVMALLLADDLASTKFALMNANADLEIKIAAARQELDELYEKKRQADAEEVTVEERHRLMRDMHDGVGTHLSLLLTSLKGGNLSHTDVTEGVQSSLDELRLLIDARSSSTQTIADALSNLRHRLQARLTPLGITTRWEVSQGADELKLNAESTLHVLRIVQECINNAVRHGNATEITLQVGTSADEQSPKQNAGFVAVKDNGCGPDKAAAASRGNGQGLKSIHSRARSIGGSFTLARQNDQTVATVSFCGD